MAFTTDQITYEPTRRPSNAQDADSLYWSVALDGGREGWAYTAASVPRPSNEWIARKLSSLEPTLSRKVLEGRMVGGRGMLLHPPRPEDG